MNIFSLASFTDLNTVRREVRGTDKERSGPNKPSKAPGGMSLSKVEDAKQQPLPGIHLGEVHSTEDAAKWILNGDGHGGPQVILGGVGEWEMEFQRQASEGAQYRYPEEAKHAPAIHGISPHPDPATTPEWLTARPL